MSDLTLILLAAGDSTRFDSDVKKQWLRVGEKPLWQFVANKFQESSFFENIIIASNKDDLEFMRYYSDHIFVEGGSSRQESLKKALQKVESEYVLVSDIARTCIDKEFLQRIISYKGRSDSVVPYIRVADTVVYDSETIDRDKIKIVQTPQLSRTSVLKKALETDGEFTDESSAIVANGGTREFIAGDENAHKITYLKDLCKITCLTPPSKDTLSGNGFDVHAFEEGKQMYLGGVKIDSSYGFAAHSDGDVVIHALIDALLGAAGMGDIGMLFPDTDALYKDIDSKELLQKVVKKLRHFGFCIVNVDLSIAAQKPRLAEYKLPMRRKLSSILGIESQKVNIKATTTEKLGFVGREEGVAVIANANLKYFDWTKI